MEDSLINTRELNSSLFKEIPMLAIAILAAGKGTRMKSSLPKVLHPLSGKTLIERVLSNCSDLNPKRQILIIGHKSEVVKKSLSHISGIEFVLQNPQNGTGHAVQELSGNLKDFKGNLLVLNGDVPLLRTETIKNLINTHNSNNASVTLLTARIPIPKGYGRVFVKKNGEVESIIEESDCNKVQRENNLTNSGIYCFKWDELKEVLPDLNNKNNQGEIYITDAISLLSKAMHLEVENINEVKGINDKIQLAECESILQERIRYHWMSEGVTFTDPKSCTISEECKIGNNVTIEPQTHIRGKCNIGDNCYLGPGSFIENTTLAKNIRIIYSVVVSSRIEDNVRIGPYANIRPDSFISSNCKIGNFVETKNSFLGDSTKVNHLSYIGDAKLGSNVNIGAGTITANYDGKNKHQTIIGDNSNTGANSVLIAPINLGNKVTIGAGSTLTKDVPDGSLAISRAKQFIKGNWPK